MACSSYLDIYLRESVRDKHMPVLRKPAAPWTRKQNKNGSRFGALHVFVLKFLALGAVHFCLLQALPMCLEYTGAPAAAQYTYYRACARVLPLWRSGHFQNKVGWRCGAVHNLKPPRLLAAIVASIRINFAQTPDRPRNGLLDCGAFPLACQSSIWQWTRLL